MSTIYLIRHGEPDWGVNELRKVVAGRRDLVPLTNEGILQAEVISNDIRLRNANMVVSSPYTRALQTACVICSKLGLPVRVEYDLHEWVPDVTWQFRNIDELQNIMADYNSCGGEHNGDRLWETKHQLRTRIQKIIHSIALQYDETIVVCHEMVIRSLLPEEENVPYCGLFEYKSEFGA